jgi:hypothetical protein
MALSLLRSLAALAVLTLAFSACASDDNDADTPAEPTTTTPSTVARPPGPAADLSTELTGGNGVFIGSALMGQTPEGYVEQEFMAAGEATSYAVKGEQTSDGKWTLTEDDTAPYKTRIIVRRPEDPAKASGIVLVEWLNVSGGVDADPDYVMTHEEIVRQGHTYVGVSAQSIGVEGGEVAVRVNIAAAADQLGKGLKGLDPARYGELEHPGDMYSYDIFTQVARALRAGGPALGDRVPTRVIALGESQSAFALTSYINGVQPVTQAFDGFFVHSRGASGLPIDQDAADIAGAIARTPTILREDTDVPIFEFQTEGDVTSVLGSIKARQDDTDTFRLWEVAGTAHADTSLIGDYADEIDCGVPINDGPQHVVAKAALRHLVAWVSNGTPPPTSPRFEIGAGAPPDVERDADGIVVGGVRTPVVDTPVRVVSGTKGPDNSVICLLLGSTIDLPASRIAELYENRADYEQQFAASADTAIDAGFVLADDRAALESYEHADLVNE